MRTLLSFLIAFFLFTSSYSQTLNTAKLDSLLMLVEQNGRGMGSVALSRGGENVYQNTFGFAEVETRRKINANTKFRIGSITKMFTATVIMQLVEEGVLKLDTSLGTYFPELPNAEKITVEQLLRHRSGLFNFTNDPGFLQWNTQKKTQDELLQLFQEKDPMFEPEEKSEYSNTNYVLLTYIIEKVEQKPYSDVIEERIFNPLGLKNTYYGGAPDAVKNEAFSYKKSANWVREPDTDMSIPAGAGAIVSTPQDLNIFLRNLFRGELVEQASLYKMKTMVEGFGIGMFIIPFYDKTAFGHSGGIDGFQSMASYFPEEDVAVSFTSNGLSMGMNDLMIGILSIFFDKSYNLPTFSPPVGLTKKELDSYNGIYSSPTFPLKITISNDGKILIGQATGQPTFPLEALGEHKFEFRQAGLVLEFNPEQGNMVLKQGGGEFSLNRE